MDDDLTGRENLGFQCRFYNVPAGEIDGRVTELLKTVDLAEAADRRAGTYSGGMRKRLDLASALTPPSARTFVQPSLERIEPRGPPKVLPHHPRGGLRTAGGQDRAAVPPRGGGIHD